MYNNTPSKRYVRQLNEAEIDSVKGVENKVTEMLKVKWRTINAKWIMRTVLQRITYDELKNHTIKR